MGSRFPLGSYPAFQAGNMIEPTFGARVSSIERSPDFAARASQYRLPNSSLWIRTYDVPAALRFPDGDFVQVRFHRSGAGTPWIGEEMVAVAPERTSVSERDAEIDFGEDVQELIWRIPRALLVQKLSVLTGSPVVSDVSFDSTFNLDRPEAGLVLRLLDSLLHAMETIEGNVASPITGELEQALITAFLIASQPERQDQLDTRPYSAAPWQVLRAESYIAQNWDKPITIEDLTAVTGASARSIFRAFKQSRGYTPLEFAKTIRLGRARHMLESVACPSVTEIAFACGFSDLSRFAKEYAQAFGERPSAVLRRSKATTSAD